MLFREVYEDSIIVVGSIIIIIVVVVIIIMSTRLDLKACNGCWNLGLHCIVRYWTLLIRYKEMTSRLL
jgi:hypothetical protein